MTEYREGVFVGYRYYDKKKMDVLFPFGHGLSYTTFAYSDLKLSAESMKDTDSLTVTAKVTNTGSVRGKAVAQLYAGAAGGDVIRPVRELKGFAKVTLEPGESREVRFTLDKRSFAYWNQKIHDWHVETGAYTIEIGASSRDLPLKGTVQIESTVRIPQTGRYEYLVVGRRGEHAEVVPCVPFGHFRRLELLGGLVLLCGQVVYAAVQRNAVRIGALHDSRTDAQPAAGAGDARDSSRDEKPIRPARARREPRGAAVLCGRVVHEFAAVLRGYASVPLLDRHDRPHRLLRRRGGENAQRLNRIAVDHVPLADADMRLAFQKRQDTAPHNSLHFQPPRAVHGVAGRNAGDLGAGRCDAEAHRPDEVGREAPPLHHLATQRIECGQHHGVRRVVEEERHASRRLERAHVAAFAPHDAALHLRPRQRHCGRGKLVHVRNGATLHGVRNDPRRHRLALLARRLLYAAGEDGRVLAQLRVRLPQYLAPGLLVRHPGKRLEAVVGLLRPRGGVLGGRLGGGGLRIHRGFPRVQRRGLAVEIRLALRLAVLHALKLLATLLRRRLERLARLHHGGARRDVGFLQARLDLALGLLLAQAHPLFDGLRLPPSHETAQRVAQKQAHDQERGDDENGDAVGKAVPSGAGEREEQHHTRPPRDLRRSAKRYARSLGGRESNPSRCARMSATPASKASRSGDESSAANG